MVTLCIVNLGSLYIYIYMYIYIPGVNRGPINTALRAQKLYANFNSRTGAY